MSQKVPELNYKCLQNFNWKNWKEDTTLETEEQNIKLGVK
jgi:hypothetical protein